MSSTDPIGDLITRIRNGQRSGKTSVKSPGSNLRKNFLEVLKKEGYIADFASKEIGKGKAELSVQLKYSNGEPVIKEISRVSKPGRRDYSKNCLAILYLCSWCRYRGSYHRFILCI